MSENENPEVSEDAAENVQEAVSYLDAPLVEPGSKRENGQPEETGFSSAPPPQAQTGVPLDEDKEAGVEAGEVPDPPGAPEVAKTPLL